MRRGVAVGPPRTSRRSAAVFEAASTGAMAMGAAQAGQCLVVGCRLEEEVTPWPWKIQKKERGGKRISMDEWGPHEFNVTAGLLDR
jgi:hypothetical protein